VLKSSTFNFNVGKNNHVMKSKEVLREENLAILVLMLRDNLSLRNQDSIQT